LPQKTSGAPPQISDLRKSATLSPIMSVGRLVLARGAAGMTDASASHSRRAPLSRQRSSTTRSIAAAGRARGAFRESEAMAASGISSSAALRPNSLSTRLPERRPSFRHANQDDNCRGPGI
jgi:hypothetical protein